MQKLFNELIDAVAFSAFTLLTKDYSPPDDTLQNILARFWGTGALEFNSGRTCNID
jgi:hypothetical protein